MSLVKSREIQFQENAVGSGNLTCALGPSNSFTEQGGDPGWWVRTPQAFGEAPVGHQVSSLGGTLWLKGTDWTGRSYGKQKSEEVSRFLTLVHTPCIISSPAV